jgi:hypothetical protein
VSGGDGWVTHKNFIRILAFSFALYELNQIYSIWECIMNQVKKKINILCFCCYELVSKQIKIEEEEANYIFKMYSIFILSKFMDK